MVGFILLIVPLGLIILHGSLAGFTFWHWLVIVVFGGSIIVPFFTAPGLERREQERMEAKNEYGAAIARLQNATLGMRGCANAERWARIDELEREVEAARKKLIEKGGYKSL